ncbi:MAG: NAD-dependent DNA ligase LigA, partial [Myxococcota bacterium]
MAADPLAADRRRMGLLIGELSRHDRLYYQEDRPEVTDAEYDRLLRELRKLEASHPALIRPDSPTQRFGAPPAEGFATVRHLEPMRSLDNATNADAMRNFDARLLRELEREEPIEYHTEPKLDGAGVELIYDQGRLSVGSTRGDGRVGEDVTANLRLCPNIPLVLVPGRPIPERVSVRGEVALSAARFERLNARRLERDQEPFANPRNAAAGSLRQLHEIDTQRLRSLEFRAYAIAIP